MGSFTDFDLLAKRVSELLEDDDGPAAFQLLDLHSHFSDYQAYNLLSCEVLVKIGRYEMCQQIAGRILQEDPDNSAANHYLRMIASATTAPPTSEQSLQLRSFGTSIPQPFLGRLQDSVHHYRYRDVQMVKSPFDMALYPLLIWNLKPRTIIEIGSKAGGSALWFADQVRNFGLDAKILSIDLIRVGNIEDPLITFLSGNGRELATTLTAELMAELQRPWLVIEDADHTDKTSLAVLEFFHPWLSPGDRIVIEDGIMSDLYPEAFPDYSSGPHKALKEFLGARANEYKIDSDYCDFFGYNVTWSPNGILKRCGASSSPLIP
jgi:cephalosporin hydroxylase